MNNFINMMVQLREFGAGFGNGDYRYRIMDSIPIWGLTAALIMFIVTLIFKEKKSMIVAVLLMGLAGFSMRHTNTLRSHPAKSSCWPRVCAHNHFLEHAPHVPKLWHAQTKRRSAHKLWWMTLIVAAVGTLVFRNFGKWKLAVIFPILLIIAGIANILYAACIHFREEQIYNGALRPGIQPKICPCPTSGPSRGPCIFPYRETGPAPTCIQPDPYRR